MVVSHHIFLKEEKDATESTPARYLVGGPGWSGAGPAAVGTVVLPLSLDDPGGGSRLWQPGAGDR